MEYEVLYRYTILWVVAGVSLQKHFAPSFHSAIFRYYPGVPSKPLGNHLLGDNSMGLEANMARNQPTYSANFRKYIQPTAKTTVPTPHCYVRTSHACSVWQTLSRQASPPARRVSEKEKVICLGQAAHQPERTPRPKAASWSVT